MSDEQTIADYQQRFGGTWRAEMVDERTVFKVEMHQSDAQAFRAAFAELGMHPKPQQAMRIKNPRAFTPPLVPEIQNEKALHFGLDSATGNMVRIPNPTPREPLEPNPQQAEVHKHYVAFEIDANALEEALAKQASTPQATSPQIAYGLKQAFGGEWAPSVSGSGYTGKFAKPHGKAVDALLTRYHVAHKISYSGKFVCIHYEDSPSRFLSWADSYKEKIEEALGTFIQTPQNPGEPPTHMGTVREELREQQY